MPSKLGGGGGEGGRIDPYFLTLKKKTKVQDSEPILNIAFSLYATILALSISSLSPFLFRLFWISFVSIYLKLTLRSIKHININSIIVRLIVRLIVLIWVKIRYMKFDQCSIQKLYNRVEVD